MSSRLVAFKVLFDWDFDGTFTDESANLVRCSGETRFNPPGQSILGSRGIVDTARIVLRNADKRYSTLNAAGPLYDYVKHGGAYRTPVRVEVSINGGAYARIFTGVTKIPSEGGRSYDSMPTVQFECRGREELLLQEKVSTTHAQFRGWANGGVTEAEAIAALVAPAGLTADSGLVPLRWVWLDDESRLEEIWQLAAAAGGRFYAGADGAFIYESFTHWLRAPHTTSQATYTNADWRTFEHYYDDGELYSTVEVEYGAREIGEETALWVPDEPIVVPAGGSRTITAAFGRPAYSAPTLVWRASSMGGVDLTDAVSVTPTWYAQRATLVVANADTTRAALIVPLEVRAQPADGSPMADEVRTSAADGANSAWWAGRGSRTRSLRGNVYVQGRAQAGTLAQALLDWHERPRLFYRVGGMLGAAARRPGDRVTFNDASVMNAGRDAFVLGVSWSWASQSYSMDLLAVDAANLFPYATTTPGYFVIGGAGVGNQLGAAHANRGRLFY